MVFARLGFCAMLTGTATDPRASISARARAIASAGGLTEALKAGAIDGIVEISLSEALVLGLLKQGVRKYFAIFGHGSTDLGEVLRIYEDEGVTRTFNCRNEVEMAHAATALRWQYGEIPAVVTSIGPGALQAMAGSLAAASNGVGVYHIYGDETTFGEGYNMQQIPKREQGLFGRMTALMGQSYVLHTPGGPARRPAPGRPCRPSPYTAGPFYMLLPINTQPQWLRSTSPRCRSGRRARARAGWRTRSMRRGRTADRGVTSGSRSRPAAARAATTVPSGGLPSAPARPWCCRPARPACCRTCIRRTCMSAARRGRSAATTPWRTPSSSS